MNMLLVEQDFRVKVEPQQGMEMTTKSLARMIVAELAFACDAYFIHILNMLYVGLLSHGHESSEGRGS